MTDGVGTLDDQYLEWLYGLVAAVSNRNPEHSYWNLLRQLYVKEFHWSVPNDDNRIEDGKYLRHEFVEERGLEGLVDPNWLTMECSFLEMLIALSRHTGFEAGGSLTTWFWRLLHNLGVERYSDDLYEISIAEEVEEVCNTVIQRTYAPDGTGGLFPLRRADRDQRTVELWYQMSAYLLEGVYASIQPRR